MPLRAYLKNEEIISIDQDKIQWDDLKIKLKSKELILILPCCKQEGFLRTSSKGLKHFVHAKSKNSCDWKPESPEHLSAKIEIIEACKEIGWTAIPEYSENNWRADVLAVQNENRIAFEIQWSRQTFEETKFRQDRYKESNVRGCWFFRSAPKELREFEGEHLKANKEIPSFRIFKDDNSKIIAQLKHTQIPLKNLVRQLLKGKLKFCENIRLKPKQEVTIIFFETKCWKCHKSQHLWTVKQNLVTVCNQPYYIMNSMWDNKDFDKSPKIYNAIIEFLQTEQGKNLKIGQLKNRFSKSVKSNYLSHGCVYCDAIFGDFFLISEKLEGPNDPKHVQHKIEFEFEINLETSHHWCYSDNGKFCE